MNIENIRIFESEPDYKFATDENTAVLWPETVTADDGSTETVIHAVEHYADIPDLFEYLIHGHDMPANVDEYAIIMRSEDPEEVEVV